MTKEADLREALTCYLYDGGVRLDGAMRELTRVTSQLADLSITLSMTEYGRDKLATAEAQLDEAKADLAEACSHLATLRSLHRDGGERVWDELCGNEPATPNAVSSDEAGQIGQTRAQLTVRAHN